MIMMMEALSPRRWRWWWWWWSWWWGHLARGNLGEYDEDDDDDDDVQYCHLAIGNLGEYDKDDDDDVEYCHLALGSLGEAAGDPAGRGEEQEESCVPSFRNWGLEIFFVFFFNLQFYIIFFLYFQAYTGGIWNIFHTFSKAFPCHCKIAQVGDTLWGFFKIEISNCNLSEIQLPKFATFFGKQKV